MPRQGARRTDEPEAGDVDVDMRVVLRPPDRRDGPLRKPERRRRVKPHRRQPAHAPLSASHRWTDRQSGRQRTAGHLCREHPNGLKELEPLRLGEELFQKQPTRSLGCSGRSPRSCRIRGLVAHANTLPPARGGQRHCSCRLSRCREVATSRVKELMLTQAPKNRSSRLENR